MEENLIVSEVEEISPEDNQAEILTKAVREDRNSMPYQTASSCIPLGAVVPTKLSFETVEALNVFKQNGIDTAEYVREKLGYPSRIAVCDAFAAEQVDAIALAIAQIEEGKGFILGDAAGIGKGRCLAGIQRYAKHIGKIPVFITIGPSLFSDMYRDIEDIGSYWSNGELPEPFIFNEDGVVQKIVGETTETLFKPLKTKETIAFCLKNQIPEWADVVFLTYSQLSQDIANAENKNQIAKYNFLKAIAPDSIFILDESHKGAGDGNIGSNLTSLLELSAGTMFASATYSKVPKSMMLYIPKTDIVDSKIRPDTIIDAVAENGEAIQEYIASLLVKSGQMIRRERTFDKCKVEYEYMHYGEKEKYYKLYDDVMALYNEIETFTKSSLYKDAVKSAISRYVLKKNIVLVDENDRKRPSSKKARAEWEERNEGKYLVSFPTTTAVKNRFQWIENLLFSIKAEYVAAQAIKLLKTNTKKNERGEIVPNAVEYINYETKEKYFVNTNYKPIVAIRNTAESALASLGYKVGDKLTPEENDYAKTLIRIAENLMVGNLVFTPADDAKKKIVIEGAYLEYPDYVDGGNRFREIVKKMKGATSGLPLSPIDHMINTIQNAKRAEWDFQYVGSDAENFRVEEITKRSIALRPRSDGKPGVEVVAIQKETATDKVGRFNSGQSDVILLNTAGATGLSMHSSHKFIDRRPRTMLIHQVELDVNTEVQKRGRINRTGQINYPGYTYIVSMIPSEIRKLMMLRRKLRSLDANTTGNVKQSAKASEILDAEGHIIEDMSNRYGYEALTIFVQEPQNELFLTLMENGKEWFELGGDPNDKFDAYLREVEKLPCIDQERFYNDMNVFYSVLKKQKEEAGEWDLETTIEDIKTSTINKKVLFVGLNTNEFSKSVYIEDKFATPRGVPLENKEALKQAEVALAGTDDFTLFHNNLIDEFDSDSKKLREEIIVNHGEPDFSNAKTKEEREEVQQEHEQKLVEILEKADDRATTTRNHLITLKPNAPFQIPIDSDQFVYFDQNWVEDNGERVSNIEYVVGVFVGYKFLAKSGNKWSPMNIELHFATTSRIKPMLKITLTKQYENLLNWIVTGKISTKEVAIVREWVVIKSGERDRIRVLTGEIFKAFEIAADLIKTDVNYKKRKKLMKYSTTNGGVETGIRMWQLRRVELTKGKTPTFAPINSKEYQAAIEQKQGELNWLSSGKEFIQLLDGKYTFGICIGVHGRGKSESRKPNKNYESEFSKKEIIDSISNEVGVNANIEALDLTMHILGGSKNVIGMKFFVFKLNKNQFSKLLNYLYSKYFVTVELAYKADDFIISDVKDTYSEKKSSADSEAGEYEYYPLLKFDPSDLSLVPPNYIVGSHKSSPDNENGIITLAYRLSPVQSALFHIVPANISEGEAVENILKSISDDNTRSEYIKKVKELGDDYLDIAIYTQQQIGVSPKYAIGKVDDIYAAEVISRNIDKPTKTKVKVQKGPVKEKTPIGWDSIQDYIITMKSL